jgi:hypothetical protein
MAYDRSWGREHNTGNTRVFLDWFGQEPYIQYGVPLEFVFLRSRVSNGGRYNVSGCVFIHPLYMEARVSFYSRSRRPPGLFPDPLIDAGYGIYIGLCANLVWLARWVLYAARRRL